MKFFYNKENSNIEQLIFKSYKTPEYKIDTNRAYRQQLWSNLKYPDIEIGQVQDLDYKKDELVNFFVLYNKYDNSELVNYEQKQKKDLFNLTLRPRLNSSSLKIQNPVSFYKHIDFGTEIGFGVGVEAEFILPFSKNKWALIIEPVYQSFKSEKELSSQNAKVDYKSIEMPFGIRHYFFLNNHSKIFINGSFVFDISGNSTIDIHSGLNLDIKTRNNLAFGLGYKHNDKYSLEIRYQTNREILSNYSFWHSDYKNLSVIFGYSFL